MGARGCVVLLTAVLALSACGEEVIVDPPTGQATASSSTPTSSAPATSETATTTPAPATGTIITVRDSDYGPMLFDDRGQAIYLFDRETNTTPACYGECADLWPPVLTEGDPRPMGADGNLLGTTTRDDGSTQVTYGGHPLYFYANEEPGQVLCHDVEDFGGTWLVVTPAGTPAPV
jgi:predicted lipoprotein with Yx(FWY)xxD motif